MTPTDDGLLSSRPTTRRDPSQRILADMDGSSRWTSVKAHPWSVALALVAPCALIAVSMFLMPMSPSVDASTGENLPAIALPSFVDARLDIAPFHAAVSDTSMIANPVRFAPSVATKSVAHDKFAPLKKRRVAASPSADVALLSVLVEHIDAQRRAASRRSKAD